MYLGVPLSLASESKIKKKSFLFSIFLNESKENIFETMLHLQINYDTICIFSDDPVGVFVFYFWKFTIIWEIPVFSKNTDNMFMR